MEMSEKKGSVDEGFRVARLEPFRVAAARGFGEHPEGAAWDALLAWMRRRGLPVAAGRFFGFNNPNPTPATPNYGYEQWVVLEGDEGAAAERATGPGEGIDFKDFPGGLYAVAEHRGSPENLPGTWGRLALAVERSRYRRSPRQWLEEVRTPELLSGPNEPAWNYFVFDLYVAVDEA